MQPLVERRTTERTWGRKVGAIVMVNAEPALTAEWLQRRLECYVAHAHARGIAASGDPLLVPGTVVAVHSAGDSSAVMIRSDDLDAARLILQRAERLQTSQVARP